MCNPPEPPLMIATDVNGTLIDEAYRHTSRARDLAETLQDAGVVIALVTSKTLDESLIYAKRLGLREECPGYIIVAEEGGVVYASNERLLPERFAVLAKPPDRRLVEELVPERCRGSVRWLDMLTPEEVSSITGLPLEEAEAARHRRSVLALHGPRDCLEEVYDALAARGYYVRLGSKFLMVGVGGGKAEAIRYVKRNSPVLRSTPVVALGDSGRDMGMLEEADYAIVVPPRRGEPLRLHRADYIVAAEPAPTGWVEALERLLPLIGAYRGLTR